MFLRTASALVTPLLLRELIDRAIPSGDTAMILALVAAMTLLPVVDVGLGLVRNYARASVGEVVTRRLRTDLFNHLIHARLDDIERTRLGHIATVLTRSCSRVGEVFVAQTVVQSIYHSMLIVVTAGIMFALNWKLALITLLAFPLSYLLARVAGNREETVEQRADGYCLLRPFVHYGGFRQHQDRQVVHRREPRDGLVGGLDAPHVAKTTTATHHSASSNAVEVLTAPM